MEIEELLMELVGITSISGDEGEISRFISEYLKESGIAAKRYKNNVYCSIGKGKPSVLLNSHMDTVPVCPNWTREPFKAREENGYIYGLGANDAKGSLSAMIGALVELAEDDIDGKVYFGASVEEECGNKGIVDLFRKIPKVDAAIIGEPTDMKIATAMRGLTILQLISKGKSAHASRPHEGENAIYRAITDITKLSAMTFRNEHPLLGVPTVSVTLIEGGTKNNIVPGECKFTLDVRSTPSYDNDDMIEAISGSSISEVEVLSNRLHSKETDERESIVKAAKKVNPTGKVIGFKGMCDFVFVDAPGVIMGPGKSKMSHAPDECIAVDDVKRASVIYRDTVKEFLLRWSP